MDHFFSIAFSLPTLVFSVMLIFVSVYWLLAIIGLLDIEILDANFDLDYGGETTPVGGMAAIMVAMGLTGLPVTLIISFIALFAWFVSYMSSLYLLSFFSLGVIFWLVALAIFIVAIMLSIPLTIIFTKPMRRFFRVNYATKSNDLLGEVCQLITSEVSEKFGEAELHKEGDHYIFQVRCQTENVIKKGDDVVLLEYDQENHLYFIKKY